MPAVTKNILLITASSLATNPRLVKNVIFYSSRGYSCTVLAFEYGNWTDELSKVIVEKYNFNCILVSASRKAIIPWIKAAIMAKISKIIYKILPTNYWISIASSKRTFQLLAVIRKMNCKYDFIEAHTLAALYPAQYLSDKKGIPFSFDVEDYHPEEIIIDAGIQEKNRRINILKKALPSATFVTAASPLIGEQIEQLLDWKLGRVISINNSFFSNEFVNIENNNSQSMVRFVWFSQKITYGRGLELFIEAAIEHKNRIELTLIGSLDQGFYNEWIQENEDFIVVKDPLNQVDLHKGLAHYDVGMVIELTSVDLNKDICLANKLFAYLQAGLFLFATDTRGHLNFFKNYPRAGVISGQNILEFSGGINEIVNSIDSIRKNRDNRFEEGKALAYEQEVNKLESAMLKII